MSELILPRTAVPELISIRDMVDHAIEPLSLKVERIYTKIKDYIVAMAGFSDAVENKLLDHIYRAVTFTPANPAFLALTTAAVNETNTAVNLTEANYTGYARLSLGTAVYGAASAGEVHNTAQ